ncbi:MAG: glycoside hydrolase family 3 C-terminal domain-containing protein [Clostridiales bacterium]|nr:glycoside hydrolase family 3 C-terminal domain-containing protein [Clostridiales bacterium]
MVKWTRARFTPNLPLYGTQRVTASPEHIELSREAAREGMVLLKNEAGLLPLAKGSKIALFGKGSFDYVKGGGGSGDVTVSYVRNIYEGLKLHADEVNLYEPLSDYYRTYVAEQYAQGGIAGMIAEPELSDELAHGARQFADTAVIVISRFSGEGWDRSDVEYIDEENVWAPTETMPRICGRVFPDGDFYLTDAERALVAKVEALFTRIVVVLNVGGVVDTTWFKDDAQIGAVLLAWQGGMEGGLAAADLLCGAASPSGKLPDSFARRLEDYPSTAGFHESPHYVDYNEDIYVGYRYFEMIPGADEKVSYPFGYGLSYTQFEIQVGNAGFVDKNDMQGNGNLCSDTIDCREGMGNGKGNRKDAEKLSENSVVVPMTCQLVVCLEVTNIGNFPGKEVVQLYYSAPQGRLGKPARQLGAFAKTKELAPGEKQIVELTISCAAMASYDDLGKIAKSAYVLEKGDYRFYVGNSVRDVHKLEKCLYLEEDIIVQQLSEKCAPTSLARRMLADGSYEELPQHPAKNPEECAFEKMAFGTDEGVAPETPGRAQHYCWEEIKPGVMPLDEVRNDDILNKFIEQLSDDDLIHLLGGQPNRGVANTFGIGNLSEYGVPNIMTADGPAGVRITPNCGVCTTAFPCATLLASTWNTELVEAVGRAGGEELKENNLSVWLTPAVNIHRNPLCGRNFEYYSEDPLLAGRLAGAMVRGIQSNHVAACVKHFACNNKETNRKKSDSRLSERALREIYLKVFEIIVKEADPWAIMSSYNIINGCRASENHELLEDILRGEWGFGGMVTTDWWTRGEHYKEIKAGNDLKMATGYPERVRRAMELGELKREDLERCAKRVLGLILKVD